MGCVRDKHLLSPEETLISQNEHLLGYSRLTAESFDLTVRKVCSGGVISDTQFEVIFKRLRLKAKNSSDCPLLPDFYTQLKGTGSLPRSRLLVLGIMLSQGDPLTKLELLFDVADTQCEEKATSDMLSSVFDTMLETATKLPKVLVSQKQFSEMQSLQPYFDTLEEARGTTRAYLHARVLKKDLELEKEKFMQRVKRARIESMVETAGLRALVLRWPRYTPVVRAKTGHMEAVDEEAEEDAESQEIE